MKNKRKTRVLSPPVDYWFLSSLILSILLIIFSILLIRERLFSYYFRVALEKYKINLNSFLISNSTNSHLQEKPTTSFSTKFIYLKPESFTLKSFNNQ